MMRSNHMPDVARLFFGAVALTLVACGGGSSATPTPTPTPAPAPTATPGPVAVAPDARPASADARGFAKPPAPAATFSATLSSATIGGDCGGPAKPSAESSMPKQDPTTAGRRPTPLRQPCRQTEMQLQLELHGAPSAKVVVRRVEVLDSAGASLGVVTPREPRAWEVAANHYAAWDEVLTEGASRRVAYKLSAPPHARRGSFQVKLDVDAVLPDGTVLPSATSLMVDIAPEPHAVT